MRVSILLPVYNAAATLPNALRSLLWQTLRDWELVVADDGSTDGGPGLLPDDRRIRLLALPHRGLVETLEAGLAACRAPLVARMDADDVCRPDRLERQVAWLEARPDLVAVGSRIRMFPTAGISPGMRRYEDWINSLVEPDDLDRDLFVESPLVHPSVVFRREAVEAVGGYRDCGWPEDYDLWLRLRSAGRLGKVPETLLFWRESGGRLTRTDPRYHLDRFRELKVEMLLPRLLGRPLWLWGAGPGGRGLARELERRGRPAEAFVDDHPGRRGQRIAGLPVRAPADLPAPGEVMLLAAVGRPGAREAIRRHLAAAGWREGRDFLCVA